LITEKASRRAESATEINHLEYQRNSPHIDTNRRSADLVLKLR
jgi:hypothetical protein